MRLDSLEKVSRRENHSFSVFKCLVGTFINIMLLSDFLAMCRPQHSGTTILDKVFPGTLLLIPTVFVMLLCFKNYIRDPSKPYFVNLALDFLHSAGQLFLLIAVNAATIAVLWHYNR